MIDRGSELSMTHQCEILDLNRTGVYYTPRPVSEAELKLMRRIERRLLTHSRQTALL